MASTVEKIFISIFLLIVSVYCIQAVSSLSHEASMMQRHEKWAVYHGRRYKDPTEKAKRYKIFKANVEYIDEVNSAGDKPYKLGVNAFADQTNEEFRKSLKGFKSPTEKSIAATSFSSKNVAAVPPRIDWRKKGAVTPLRNETCGGWTFNAVDTVEGLTKIKTGKLYVLSVQEIVDCNIYPKNDCDKGSTNEAFEFVKENGLTTEAIYHPKAKRGTCNKEEKAKPVTKISGYQHVPANNETLLMDAVASLPVAAMVDGGAASFQFYAGGILTGQCGTELNLGVTIVGYGTSNDGIKFWIAKNRWGYSWGEEGYIRIQKDIGAKEGMCGIAMEASYPTA